MTTNGDILLRITDIYLISDDPVFLWTCFWNKHIPYRYFALEIVLKEEEHDDNPYCWFYTLGEYGTNTGLVAEIKWAVPVELTATLTDHTPLFNKCLFSSQWATDTLLNMRNINLNKYSIFPKKAYNFMGETHVNKDNKFSHGHKYQGKFKTKEGVINSPSLIYHFFLFLLPSLPFFLTPSLPSFLS